METDMTTSVKLCSNIFKTSSLVNFSTHNLKKATNMIPHHKWLYGHKL